jgi:hypothetical protein
MNFREVLFQRRGDIGLCIDGHVRARTFSIAPELRQNLNGVATSK